MLLDLSTEFSEGITWAEASVDSIKTVVRSELGEYYIKMYNSIGETYAQLQEANPDITIDWYNNFE
jgi:hypothetical protein